MGDRWSAGLPGGATGGVSCHSAISHGTTPQKANVDDAVSAAANGRGWESHKVSSAQGRIDLHTNKDCHYRSGA